jgi:hypothetical protein
MSKESSKRKDEQELFSEQQRQQRLQQMEQRAQQLQLAQAEYYRLVDGGRGGVDSKRSTEIGLERTLPAQTSDTLLNPQPTAALLPSPTCFVADAAISFVAGQAIPAGAFRMCREAECAACPGDDGAVLKGSAE